MAGRTPSADFGVAGAIRRLQDILGGAIASIPACPGEATLCASRAQAGRAADAGGARAPRGVTADAARRTLARRLGARWRDGWRDWRNR